jgi:chromosomal replication initiator protein
METKIAILKRKAYEKKCPVSDNVLTFLAKDSGNDVRTLEGRLTKVIFASKLQECPITTELAASALNESVSEEKESITCDLIVNSVCTYYKMNKNELLNKCKKKELVEPRHICIYLICELMSMPLVAIGEYMGGRDHTTIIHVREKIKKTIKINDKMAKTINDIKNSILKQ